MTISNNGPQGKGAKVINLLLNLYQCWPLCVHLVVLFFLFQKTEYVLNVILIYVLNSRIISLILLLVDVYLHGM